MIKVTITTNANRTTDIVSGSTTIREVFEKNNVNYTKGSLSVDGINLRPGDLDKSFDNLGVVEKCFLNCIIKADNAANVKIVGSACVVTSSVKLEDYKLVEKYRPEALKLYDEDNEHEVIFAVSTTENEAGSIDKYGAEFGPVASSEGYATITMLIVPGDDTREVVKEKMGVGLLRLNKIEEGIAAALESIREEDAMIEQFITEE